MGGIWWRDAIHSRDIEEHKVARAGVVELERIK